MVATFGSTSPLRHVSQAILISQLLFNERVNLTHRLLLRDFEQAATRLIRDARQNLLTVGSWLCWKSAVPAHSPAHGATHAKATLVPAIAFVIFIKDRIHGGVCSLSGRHRNFQALLAATVDAVGEHDQGLATLLLLHQFLGREVDSVVQESPATHVMPA